MALPADRHRARALQPRRRRGRLQRGGHRRRGARPRSRTSRARIRRAITEWDVTYFKFDFLAWLDCAGQGDLYAFRDAFLAMLDRIRADHPKVTLQIDETNDYRLFPFASTSRGPTWFQNGHPTPDQLLHNLWNLSPYVPTYALGQHVLGGGAGDHPVATSMAAALASHISFFIDVRKLPGGVVARPRRGSPSTAQPRARSPPA